MTETTHSHPHYSTPGQYDDSADAAYGPYWPITNSSPLTDPLTITVTTPPGYGLSIIGAPVSDGTNLVIALNAVSGGGSASINVPIAGFMPVPTINIVVYENYAAPAPANPKGTHVVHTGMGGDRHKHKHLIIHHEIRQDLK